MQVLHLFLIFASASENSKYQTLKFCLTSQFLSTYCIATNSLFLVCFHHSSEWDSVPAKAGLMEQWKNNFEPGGPWGWLYIIFPPQCECIIVWAVPVRNDNRGWHWKVPEFSCLKMSLGWLRQNATQGEGRGYDKTTTLKCDRSLSNTPAHTQMCIFFSSSIHRTHTHTHSQSPFWCHFI